MFAKKMFLLLLYLWCVCKADYAFSAGDDDFRQLREQISTAALAELERTGTPSIQVAVRYGESLLFNGAFGLADVENDVQAKASSRYRTASVAKWFTATAAMKLVDGGLLDLDAPIQKYCAAYPVKTYRITTRHLLTHTAGVRGYLDYDELVAHISDSKELAKLNLRRLEEEASFYRRYTDITAPLETFKNDSLIFEPGSNWMYTSFGYRLLACVLEGASHIEYRQLMNDFIFKPAGMESTVPDDAWAIIPGRVSGYYLGRDKSIRRANMRDVSENLPAGGYLSTASDLVAFASAFNHYLLPESVKTTMLVPARGVKLDTDTPYSWRDAMPNADKYGAGIMLFSKYEQGMIGHTGRQDGGSSIVVLIPSKDLAIAVMTNAKGWNGYMDFTMKIKSLVEKYYR
ncbi:serine hydrolase domain-containing protein [Teredinibacter turnerae]|uniref:serine hydrolase domain-containing protein n=1 Tax=Teredinibacter turnerae TaxID=2426 RepID=UPI00037D2892|nr:serine hydrolase domain-containing protein [Teredinibacter turnerae]